ncbi:MAG: glycosyltransferase family 2 protein [Eubacteriales bacterium]|nr:glycosyltransferase family 2 protein [Eubacteriales bacterium]
MVTISMCMIVKNEEQFLRRCLDSYAGTYDELIIVDTGSTDSTKAIALEYTDKVFDYQWKEDFADARNFAFSKAACEYIFSADADEVLDDKNRQAYIDLKSVLLTEIEIVQMKYVNCQEFNTVYNFKKEYRPKLFKRLRTFTWISPIHETVRLTPVVFDSDIEILHMPAHSHSKRDFSTFLNAIENGVYLEDYVVIMYCKELFISGEPQDFLAARAAFENVLAGEARGDDCTRNILCVLARIYRLADEKDNFYKLCLSDVETGIPAGACKGKTAGACSEICMELGLNYYGLEDYYGAIKWFMSAAADSECIIDIRCGGDMPRRYLSYCYEKIGNQARLEGDIKTAQVCGEYAAAYKKEADEWEYPKEI